MHHARPTAKSLLPVGMMAIESYGFSSIDERLKAEKRAKNELHNAKMSGRFIPAKERKRLEDKAGIGGNVDQITAANTPERNAPCPCGSGKKYKKCCALQTV